MKQPSACRINSNAITNKHSKLYAYVWVFYHSREYASNNESACGKSMKKNLILLPFKCYTMAPYLVMNPTFCIRRFIFMANIKSQKKRILTNEKSRQRNVAVRSRVKTIVKKTDEALSAKDAEKAKTDLAAAISEIDRACTKGVIHPNQAARRKSSLQRRYNQMLSQGA